MCRILQAQDQDYFVKLQHTSRIEDTVNRKKLTDYFKNLFFFIFFVIFLYLSLNKVRFDKQFSPSFYLHVFLI